jgi:hypothetical protein
MKQDHYSIFFMTMMTGLFVGIMDTLICLAFNIGYRNATGYMPSAFINVSSLIFCTNLLLTIIGIVYYAFLRVFRKGDAIYFVFFLLVTAFLAWKITGIHRFTDVKENSDFKGLLGGIVLILGVSAACLPLLYRSRKFTDAII